MVRTGREEWGELYADDVVWITEWQLAAAYQWVPLERENAIYASGKPEPGGRFWPVAIRAGEEYVAVRLPLRELAAVIRWCRKAATLERALQPPARVQAALRVLRQALRPALEGVDPLSRMGYAERVEGTAS